MVNVYPAVWQRIVHGLLTNREGRGGIILPVVKSWEGKLSLGPAGTISFGVDSVFVSGRSAYLCWNSVSVCSMLLLLLLLRRRRRLWLWLIAPAAAVMLRLWSVSRLFLSSSALSYLVHFVSLLSTRQPVVVRVVFQRWRECSPCLGHVSRGWCQMMKRR